MHEALAAAELVERAFGIARQSGKTDWWAMAIPVLKNRLLQLTNNTFREADFGATSFRDFLRKIPDVVRIDEAPLPGFVILRSAAPERSNQPSKRAFRGERVRADLWRALLDYSSGQRYVWDTGEQVARPARSDEDSLVIPTASAADLDEWRAEFVAAHKPSDADVARRVEEWYRNRLPTAELPAPVRPAWNNYLKRKVEQRVQHWFESNSITAPPIVELGHGSYRSDGQVEALREFILNCVRTMSKQELSELRISPVTAMRVLSYQKPHDSE